MDYIEVEGKTYEEAVRKAALGLNADEKDLEIDVTEVDTKGILGLLGSKKIRITARLRERDLPESAVTPEEYGKSFLQETGRYFGLSLAIQGSKTENRLIFHIQADHGDHLIGKDGETLEALQYLLKLAIAKRYKQGQKITIDINGYREKRKKSLSVMAKTLGDKARRTGRSFKTNPLNPYERIIVHTLFKNYRNLTTKSEGEGHIKQVVISPVKTSRTGRGPRWRRARA